jgi:hypothetical protein
MLVAASFSEPVRICGRFRRKLLQALQTSVHLSFSVTDFKGLVCYGNFVVRRVPVGKHLSHSKNRKPIQSSFIQDLGRDSTMPGAVQVRGFRPRPVGLYFRLALCLLANLAHRALISSLFACSASAALTASCADCTGGNSRTVSYRVFPSSSWYAHA